MDGTLGGTATQGQTVTDWLRVSLPSAVEFASATGGTMTMLLGGGGGMVDRARHV